MNWFSLLQNRLILYCGIALLGFLLIFLNNRELRKQLEVSYRNPQIISKTKLTKVQTIKKDKTIISKLTKFDSSGRIITVLEKEIKEKKDSVIDSTSQKTEESKPILSPTILNRITLLGSYPLLGKEYSLGLAYKVPIVPSLSVGLSVYIPSFNPSLLVLLQF